jgi:hypothetical protein
MMPDESVEASDSDYRLAFVKGTWPQIQALLGRGGLDYLDRPRFKEDREGVGQLLVVLSGTQIEGLRAEGFEVEVLLNQSARWRERVAQIGKRDPFEGSRIPRGTGKKVKSR